jgi:serine/threonine protein kinase
VFPKDRISTQAQDLIRTLCQIDPEKRPSIQQVQKHPWFKDVHWNKVLNKEKSTIPSLEKLNHRLQQAKKREAKKEKENNDDDHGIWKDWD